MNLGTNPLLPIKRQTALAPPLRSSSQINLHGPRHLSRRILGCRWAAHIPVRFIPIAVAMASILAAGCTLLATKPYVFNGLLFDDPVTAPGFTLTDQNFQRVSLRDFHGQIVLLFFGFTNCPDACPATLETWKQLRRALGENSQHVRFVMITLDPERDTAERLGKHLSLFHPEFIGLTGSVTEIEDVAQDYNVFFETANVGSASGYLVNHTTLTYIIDTNGKLVLAHRSYETKAQEIADDLEQLLK